MYSPQPYVHNKQVPPTFYTAPQCCSCISPDSPDIVNTHVWPWQSCDCECHVLHAEGTDTQPTEYQITVAQQYIQAWYEKHRS